VAGRRPPRGPAWVRSRCVLGSRIVAEGVRRTAGRRLW
jgi:hypothetical protein